MTPGRATAPVRRITAGVAAFLRQLSLFDPPDPPVPTAPARTQAAPAAKVTLGLPRSAFAHLCVGPYAHIEVAVRPRLHESWRVTWLRRREALRLEIPALLAEAPQECQAALLEWALLASQRKHKDAVRRARRLELETTIRDHLRGGAQAQSGGAMTPAAKRRAARDGRKLARLRPQGECHDLDSVLSAVNARYFGGTLQARISWAARLGGLSTHTIAQDAEGRPYHLLTISRGYDCPEVTPEILGGVVYHECLHIAIPPRREGGRRVVHGGDFRKREREYDHYRVWREWHREGLPRALRRMMRGRG